MKKKTFEITYPDEVALEVDDMATMLYQYFETFIAKLETKEILKKCLELSVKEVDNEKGRNQKTKNQIRE